MEKQDNLLLALLYLKGVFQPDSFCFFEESNERRCDLVESFSKPFEIVCKITHEMSYPDFSVLERNIDTLSFIQCAAYMMYYLRMAKRQGGGEYFIKLWRNGTALRLTQRFLDILDTGDR